jgi:hypothetical protein
VRPQSVPSRPRVSPTDTGIVVRHTHRGWQYVHVQTRGVRVCDAFLVCLRVSLWVCVCESVLPVPCDGGG